VGVGVGKAVAWTGKLGMKLLKLSPRGGKMTFNIRFVATTRPDRAAFVLPIQTTWAFYHFFHTMNAGYNHGCNHSRGRLAQLDSRIDDETFLCAEWEPTVRNGGSICPRKEFGGCPTQEWLTEN
jgi:hypothetical protein